MDRSELIWANRLLRTMALDETVGDKIRRLIRNLPIDKTGKRTARIIAFRALREQRARQVQDELNGHFDFGD